MSQVSHRPGMHVEAVMNKVIWLRQRPHVDLDVAETLDLIAEALIRLDANHRAQEGRVQKIVTRLGSRMGDLEKLVTGRAANPQEVQL